MTLIPSTEDDQTINPFPPLGEMRIWKTSYLRRRLSNVPNLKWETLPSLNSDIINRHVPTTYGVYIFVRINIYPQLNIAPIQTGYICYVGKSENLRNRMLEYYDIVVNEKCTARPKVKEMFLNCHYNEDLKICYALCSPESYSHVEDTLIQAIDPIFCTSSRLDKDKLQQFMIYGDLLPPQQAFTSRGNR